MAGRQENDFCTFDPHATTRILFTTKNDIVSITLFYYFTLYEISVSVKITSKDRRFESISRVADGRVKARDFSHPPRNSSKFIEYV